MYRFVELEQDTDAWLAWRRGGIGGSDAAAAIGASRYKSPEQLVRIKTGLEREEAPGAAALEGKLLEPEARRLYMLQAAVTVRPRCIQSERYEWLRASLDGISEDGTRIVEIKCGARNFEDVRAFGEPPPHYYAQCQHVLAMTGLASIDYFSYRPDERPILLTIDRDERYIARLLDEEARIWERVQRTQAA